ncbi:hypothetical protein J5N97_023216 [Dioscorea zingiberensis]|uniref:Uncharacterized protein n=1 Tax=Dioscorea zingiberensis TaxID=325984 RepID=A0A9D5HBC7_9LILI|nr:hypothetical protein J5N97_023216 [Dioscorea zingiberensis]
MLGHVGSMQFYGFKNSSVRRHAIGSAAITTPCCIGWNETGANRALTRVCGGCAEEAGLTPHVMGLAVVRCPWFVWNRPDLPQNWRIGLRLRYPRTIAHDTANPQIDDRHIDERLEREFTVWFYRPSNGAHKRTKVSAMILGRLIRAAAFGSTAGVPPGILGTGDVLKEARRFSDADVARFAEVSGGQGPRSLRR